MKRILIACGLAAFLFACGGSGSGSAPEDIASDEPDIPVRTGDFVTTDLGNPDKEVQQDAEEPSVETPPGYNDPCFNNDDCSDFGLQCYSEGPAGSDMDSICSKECESAADCPEMMVCKRKGDFKICQLATYCDECSNDTQCGGDTYQCIEDQSGVSFCSPKCVKDDPESCSAGDYCKKVGTGFEEYFCYPMFGTCRGDGTHCTPCQSDNDCAKGHQCHENPYTHERYCAKTCQVKMDCPKGFGCVEDLVGETEALCTLDIDGEYVETCYKGNKNYCEPCLKNYECESGVCYNYPVANKYFCTFPCDTSTYPAEGCPSGLFCAPNHGESGGEVCVPPTAWGCQGFLNCMQVECDKGEKCTDGFCEPK